MKPLLEMTNIPISIEINVTRGSYEQSKAETPKMKVNVNKGGLEMSAEPASLKIDSYKAMASMGYGNLNEMDMLKSRGDEGIKLAYEGTANVVQEGNSLERGVSPAEIAAQKMRAGFSIETVMDFIPKEGPEITYNEGKLNVNYTVDEVDIDWDDLFHQPIKFHPGKIEVVVEQMPRVEITYVGDPIYVPRSADPNYKPMFESKG